MNNTSHWYDLDWIITFITLGILLWFLFSAIFDADAGENDYYDLLAAKPEAILSKAYRTQAEIDSGMWGSGITVYDSGMDAAKFILLENEKQIAIADQLRPNTYTATNTGTLLFFWESYWPSDFVADGGINGLNTHKAFQIARDDSLSIEPRTRFSQVDSPYVARTDVRGYGNTAGYYVGPFDTIADEVDGQGEFNILPNVWVRFWVLLDFTNDKIWYWIGDENRANVIILDDVDLDYSVAFASPNDQFDEFWFEYNSSQERTGPEIYIWGRNLVILKDVSDPASLVAQGEFGGGTTGNSTGNFSGSYR